jgi:hypothetical protein
MMVVFKRILVLFSVFIIYFFLMALLLKMTEGVDITGIGLGLLLFFTVFVPGISFYYLKGWLGLHTSNSINKLLQDAQPKEIRLTYEMLFRILQGYDYINLDTFADFMERHKELTTIEHASEFVRLANVGTVLSDKEKWDLGLPVENTYHKEFINIFHPEAFETIEPIEWITGAVSKALAATERRDKKAKADDALIRKLSGQLRRTTAGVWHRLVHFLIGDTRGEGR